MSSIASSLGVPAVQPLRTLSLHTPSTGMNLWHFSEFAPPPKPSQRHRYALEASRSAASRDGGRLRDVLCAALWLPSTLDAAFCATCRAAKRRRNNTERYGRLRWP